VLEGVLQLGIELDQYPALLDAVVQLLLSETRLLVGGVEFLDRQQVDLGLLQTQPLEVGEERNSQQTLGCLDAVHVLAALGTERNHLEQLLTTIGQLESTQQQFPDLQKLTGCGLALEDLLVLHLCLEMLEADHAAAN
jgi:hypothetical protein